LILLQDNGILFRIQGRLFEKMTTDYFFTLGKIVEGAANGDSPKVLAYGEQLAKKLEENGEAEAAKRIRTILERSEAAKLTLARLDQRRNGAAPVPVDSESRLPTADEEYIGRNGEAEAFLPPSVEKAVGRFLTFFRAADRLVASGVGVSASMLIYGPPGCGKTQLARFIAKELELPLITARTDGLISSYLGSTAKNLRQLFEHAMSRPCVLFLDEFDALAKMRDDAREMGELKRVVISLLQNIDAMGKDHVLLAATNHQHLLDPAIWRRFAYKVQLNEPDADLRKRMLQKFFGAFGDEELIQAIAALSDGMNGAQLRQVAEECVRIAILADQKKVPIRDAVLTILAANPDASANGSLAEQLKTMRNLDRKLFTQVRLAEIFDISQAQVSKLLKGGVTSDE
jgi:MoxR-like ATPase